MSFGAKLTVTNNRFPELVAAFPDITAQILNNAIDDMVAAADPLTPVDTGALRANKTITLATSGNQNGSVTWNQPYVVYQEFGTVHNPPRSFIRGGADAATPRYLDALAGLERLL